MLHDEKCALWRQRLAAQQASGLTVVAWCFQQGIGVKAYYYWRKRLLTPGKPPVSTSPQWLALAPEAASTSSLTLQVGPVVITITADFDPQLLSAAIRAITGEGGKIAMLSEIGVEQVYLACGSTDLRKSIDGLSAMVQQTFSLDPFAPVLFVFCNRQRDKLKILFWEHNGFWLIYRRLERGRFAWPKTTEGLTCSISRRQLQWLLSGLAIEQRKAHPAVTASKIL